MSLSGLIESNKVDRSKTQMKEQLNTLYHGIIKIFLFNITVMNTKQRLRETYIVYLYKETIIYIVNTILHTR